MGGFAGRFSDLVLIAQAVPYCTVSLSGVAPSPSNLTSGARAQRMRVQTRRRLGARNMATLDGASEPPVEDISTDDHEHDHEQLSAAEGIDRAEMAAQLSGATSAIAGQLQMITEEMNRLRSEIYSDNGLGSIKKELENLRSGGALSPRHSPPTMC